MVAKDIVAKDMVAKDMVERRIETACLRTGRVTSEKWFVGY